MPEDTTNRTAPDRLRIESGHDEFLVASDGRKYVDLVSGYGAALLGHCSPSVVDRVRRQLGLTWTTARLDVPVLEEAVGIVNSLIGRPYRLVQFCSSGNEAVEFAIRIAAIATGRKAFVGFSHSMHGKSVAASAMCWGNQFADIKNLQTLPFVDSCAESDILAKLENMLASIPVAAVFIEPIQGSSGAHEGSPEFYHGIARLCSEYGSKCVVDEVLTGFYRAGAVSYSLNIGLSPDVLIFGKAMGNGFPVAAVVCREEIDITAEMLPGSTFSDNPLAAAAVAATLAEMARIDVGARVDIVHEAIESRLGALGSDKIKLRGRGALWVLELPNSRAAQRVKEAALAKNILVSAYGPFVRLFPPATISHENLSRSLDVIGTACLSILDG